MKVMSSESIKNAIAPTIAAVLIMIVTLYFFGMENSMIAPFAILSYMRFLQMKCHYQCMLKHFLLYCVVIAAAYFANMNIPLCIIMDILVFFGLSYLVIDEYDPTNYFPIGMGMIMLQSAAITTPEGLIRRYLALFVSFGIIFIFVLIMAAVKYEKDPIYQYILQGLDICDKQIELCKAGDIDGLRSAHMELREINKKCCDEIYAYNRTTFKKKGFINYYCRFIVVFQVINYLTHYYDPATAADTSVNLKKAREIIDKYRQMLLEHKPHNDYWQLRFRSGRIDVKEFRFRFAMRMTIVMTAALAFAFCSQLPNISWLPFSLFFMLIPSTDDTASLVIKRVLGSVLGISGCLVLFWLIPSVAGRVVMTAIFSFLIYSAESFLANVAFVTCATLAMQTINMDPLTSMWQCLLYTAIAAVIALLANHFLFPIHTSVQITRYLDKQLGIRKRLQEMYVPDDVKEVFGGITTPKESELDPSVNKEIEVIRTPASTALQRSLSLSQQQKHERDQLTIHSYLIAKRIEDLDLSRKEQDPRLLEIEKEHMRFMAEIIML